MLGGRENKPSGKGGGSGDNIILLKIMSQVVEVGESLGLEHREEVMLSKPEDEEVHKNK